MIEEQGAVIALDGDYAWVETQKRSTCESCSVSKGCGTGVLAKATRGRSSRVRVANDCGARVGDLVVVALSEDALLRGSLAVYLVPLLSMLLFGLLGDHLASAFNMAADGGALMLGMAGLFAGLGWVRVFSNKVMRDQRYQPVILRRIA